jgi:hypothetical protein
MIKIFAILLLIINVPTWAQSSMRRCTLLPITDSVGGAIGFKVFEELEETLKKSNWCTYVSNSGLINVFSKYRDNLPKYLKTKEVLSTVGSKLQVGSIIRISIVNEVRGVELEMEVSGENGEDIFFSEKTTLDEDDISTVVKAVQNWFDVYAKMIPYDAKVNGVLGDQVTLDVGKGYPIQEGQKFTIRRLINKKNHPLLKKIVDWETSAVAEGVVSNLSDNQALGIINSYKAEKKILAGDWVRLMPQVDKRPIKKNKEKDEESPGTLGILSISLFASNSSVDNSTPTGSNRMSGNLFGIDFRVEGWITRQYFGALEIVRGIGGYKKDAGNPEKDRLNANNGSFKITGGYKYLPIGFFYGPQIDIYGGYANYDVDLDYSRPDGFDKNSISGILLGTAANIPLNREYRIFARADFIPFPSFSEDDEIYGSAKSVSAMELEIGIKYNYTQRMTLDGSVETVSRKAKFGGQYKEVSYKDNLLKFGVSFNF